LQIDLIIIGREITNTFERVRSIVAEALNTTEEKITSQTSLTEDLIADSLDRIEIAMALEEAFCIEFEEEALTLTRIQQIVEYIEGRMREQP
jgi:acyl carrier protein